MSPNEYQQVLEQLSETRRHFDVVGESLRGEVQQVAEAAAELQNEVRAVRAEMTSEFQDLKSMIKFSYAELDRRVATLEETVQALQSRVGRLEQTSPSD